MAEYINRQEAIETVAFYLGDPDGVDHALRSIKDIPTADVQPVKHGRWSGYLCSNCGISKYNFISFNFDDQNGYARPFGTWNYCPHCGAKMDGDKNG